MNLNQALPLREFILDIRGTAKEQALIMNNIVDLYNLPFEKDHIESLFEFPEIFLGENDKGEIDWSTYTSSGSKYSLDGGATLLNTPQTVSDFIEDCYRYWSIDLVWEGNLMKRKFSI